MKVAQELVSIIEARNPSLEVRCFYNEGPSKAKIVLSRSSCMHCITFYSKDVKFVYQKGGREQVVSFELESDYLQKGSEKLATIFEVFKRCLIPLEMAEGRISLLWHKEHPEELIGELLKLKKDFS